MKKSLMFLALASIGLASCNGGFKKGDGGMLYEIHTSNGGPTIQVGDFISVNMIAKTDADSVLFSTYEAGHPIQTIVPQSQFKGDIFSGIEKMAEGDSATIKVCIDSMFKKGQPRPQSIKGNYLVYVIKVEKVLAKGKLSEQVFQGRISAYMKGLDAEMAKDEQAKIKKYIAHEKLNVIQTADSLDYVITQQGTGPRPSVGDTVVVNYTGRLLSGKIFDTSIADSATKAKIPAEQMHPYKPIRIPVGEKKIIAGWDEGLMLLNKGAKASFIIPSSLAYGEQGAGNVIGPFTPIAFDVEVVDIIKPDPNAPKPPANPLLAPQANTPGKGK